MKEPQAIGCFAPENGISPNAKGNDLRFGVKGSQSRNYEDKTEDQMFSRACCEILGSVIPGDPMGRTYVMGIAERLAIDALRGSFAAARELADRSEGRPRPFQNIDSSRDLIPDLIEEMTKQSKVLGPPERSIPQKD